MGRQRRVGLALTMVMAACVVAGGLGIAIALAQDTDQGKTGKILPPCADGSYLNVFELETYCGVPGECRRPLPCEGQEALVYGWIDYEHLVDEKRDYPERSPTGFRLMVDRSTSRFIGVNLPPGDNSGLLEQMKANQKHPENAAYVRGLVVGIDLPMETNCIHWVHIQGETIFFAPEDFAKSQKKVR